MSEQNDDAEPSGAYAGSHDECEQALFSERSSMANAAVRWCDQIGVLPVAFNVVTALFRLGLVQKPQHTLTDEERAAIESAIDVFAESAIHINDEVDRRRAGTLRGLLRRLG